MYMVYPHNTGCRDGYIGLGLFLTQHHFVGILLSGDLLLLLVIIIAIINIISSNNKEDDNNGNRCPFVRIQYVSFLKLD